MALSARPSKIPNTEKLFMYLQKEQWQNVSANFSGFVKKEFDSAMTHLEEDEENFKELKMMIDYAEMGRYNDAKTLLEPAYKEYEELESYLRNGFKSKLYQRPTGNPSAHENRHQTYTPAKQENPAQKHAYDSNMHDGKGRDTYSPNKRDSLPGSPKRAGSETYDKREVYSPGKRDMHMPQKHELTPNITARQPREEYSPRHQLGVGDRSSRTPQRGSNQHNTYDDPNRDVGDRSSRTPQRASNQHNTYEDHHRDVGDRSSRTPQKGIANQNAYDDPHRRNYDSLRLGSPEKGKVERPGSNNPSERDNSSKFEHRHGGPTGFDQFASSREMWGRHEGDKPKQEYSTYRQEYPEHVIAHFERQDKNRYRDNFGSASEKDFMHYDYPSDMRDDFSETLLVGNDVRIKIDSKHEKLHRLHDTPDNDVRPSELARRFKEIYTHEWTDAYDEIVKEYEPEKSVKYLLWVVTEAWLIALELGDKQLKDLEKSTYSIMSRPGSENHRIMANSRDLGESLPTSRHLLLKYRKQTAALSVPYVKEQCRMRVCQSLLEKSGFQKKYLTDASRVVAYINKCAEIVWLMSVQDPPVVLEYITKETEGARFNAEHYHTYTSPGAIYKYGVWPLLRLDKKGPVLAKGIAQGVQ